MNYLLENVRTVLGLLGTAVIAGWVAWSVSAPRNVENAMNEPMAQLGGSSINDTIKETQAQVRSDQCERFTQMARDAWDQAVERGTIDQDSARVEQLERERDRYCN